MARRTVDSELDSLELLEVIRHDVGVSLGDDFRLVAESAAAECAEDNDIGTVGCSDVEDLASAAHMELVEFVVGNVRRWLTFFVVLGDVLLAKVRRCTSDHVEVDWLVKKVVVVSLQDGDVRCVDDVIVMKRADFLLVVFVESFDGFRLCKAAVKTRYSADAFFLCRRTASDSATWSGSACKIEDSDLCRRIVT